MWNTAQNHGFTGDSQWCTMNLGPFQGCLILDRWDDNIMTCPAVIKHGNGQFPFIDDVPSYKPPSVTSNCHVWFVVRWRTGRRTPRAEHLGLRRYIPGSMRVLLGKMREHVGNGWSTIGFRGQFSNKAIDLSAGFLHDPADNLSSIAISRIQSLWEHARTDLCLNVGACLLRVRELCQGCVCVWQTATAADINSTQMAHKCKSLAGCIDESGIGVSHAN